MKKIYINKLLVILSLFTILISTIFTNVFASFDFTTSDGNNYTVFDVPSDGNSYFIVYPLYSNIIIITSSVPICHGFDAGGYSATCYRGKDMHKYYSASKDYSTYSREDESAFSTYAKDNYEYMYTGSSAEYRIDKLLYSNHDITDKYGKVVFQGAPLTPTPVEPLKITQVEEIQPAVAKIVDLVLPACLIIFGTLLVLYLIKSKNLLQL